MHFDPEAFRVLEFGFVYSFIFCLPWELKWFFNVFQSFGFLVRVSKVLFLFLS